MVKASGYNSHVLLHRQASFNAPYVGNYHIFPVFADSVGRTAENNTDQLAGEGRDMTYITRDVNEVGGDLRVPICLRAFGHILTGIFGNAVTVENSGVFTHTFKSGALDLPTFSKETGHKGPGKFLRSEGLMFNVLTMPFTTGGGRAEATVSVIGKSETAFDASQGGTPIDTPRAFVSNFSGTLKKGGVLLGDVTSATLTYNNGMTGEREVNGGPNIAVIDIGISTLGVTLGTRFSTKTQLDEALAGTPMDLEFAYRLSDTMKLSLTLHQAMPNVPKAPIEGPGGYGLDFSLTGILNNNAGAALTAVLVNDVAGTVYTPA